MEAAGQITVEERHLSVDDWVRLTLLKLLASQALGVPRELLTLCSLEGSKTSIHELGVFARERADLRWQAGVEQEVHDSLVFGLYGSRLLSLFETEADGRLDRVLLSSNALQLFGADSILEHF